MQITPKNVLPPGVVHPFAPPLETALIPCMFCYYTVEYLSPEICLRVLTEWWLVLSGNLANREIVTKHEVLTRRYI